MNLSRTAFISGLAGLFSLAVTFSPALGAQTRPAPPTPPAPAAVSPAPGTVPAAARATRVDYRDEAQLRALAAQGPTVVFFAATWCPACRAALRAFSQNWEKVEPGITLVVADYDQVGALRRRYGVAAQHTFVQVGPDLSRLKLWSGGDVALLNANTVRPR